MSIAAKERSMPIIAIDMPVMFNQSSYRWKTWQKRTTSH